MSKSTNARRRGLAAVATTALVAGACVAGAGAASAAPSALGLTADSAPNVTQGAPNQAAGDLHFVIPNAVTTNSTVTFKTPASCDTQANIDKAVEYASAPTVTVTRDQATDTTTVPKFTSSLGSSSTACATAGVQDVVTVTFTQPSSTVSADEFDINVTGIKYNVGSKTPTGPVTVTATPTGIAGSTPDTADNANVVNKSFTFIPKTSAQPGTSGNDLGTATFKESTGEAYFAAGATTPVKLHLSAGGFTAGVTPTITVPSGYKVYKDAAGTQEGTPVTDGTADYTFYVKAPATVTSPATVTVAGLEADAPSTVQTVKVTPTVGSDVGTAIKALNVVDQDRIGGDDRYATAAKLFNAGGYKSGNAVLSGGELFPDALSANYLAKELNTGTLLTRSNKLSQDARQALLDNNVTKVYITGLYGAVSQGVEDEVKSLHVGNVPTAANIQVIRLGGDDRYATNKKVNTSQLHNSSTVVMAAGTAPYDSLAVGPVVYAQDYPLILTDGSTLKHGELTQLQNVNAKNIVIVGGEGVVSKGVADELKKDGYNVVRLAGDTRYSTATAIAAWASEGYDFNGDGDKADNLEAAQGLDSSTLNITNGQGFADALSAGPLAGSNSETIVLAKNVTEVGQDLADYLGTKSVGTGWTGTNVGTLRALGLTGAISNSLLDDAAADIG